MNRNFLATILVALTLPFAAACSKDSRHRNGGGSATPTPTPVATATPTPSSTPTPTATPTPAPTASPTPTPSPGKTVTIADKWLQDLITMIPTEAGYTNRGSSLKLENGAVPGDLKSLAFANDPDDDDFVGATTKPFANPRDPSTDIPPPVREDIDGYVTGKAPRVLLRFYKKQSDIEPLDTLWADMVAGVTRVPVDLSSFETVEYFEVQQDCGGPQKAYLITAPGESVGQPSHVADDVRLVNNMARGPTVECTEDSSAKKDVEYSVCEEGFSPRFRDGELTPFACVRSYVDEATGKAITKTITL